MDTQTLPWPFTPLHAQSLEDSERWWAQCYLPGNETDGLVSWRVLVGRQGSGKTVAIEALRRSAQGALVLDYPPRRWPGSPQALAPGKDHPAQLMAGAAQALRSLLGPQHPALPRMKKEQLEFLRWLNLKYASPRIFERWRNNLPAEIVQPLDQLAYTDLYPSTTGLDLTGQVDELLEVCAAVGLDRVLILCDLNGDEARQHTASLLALFELSDLMLRPDFVLVATLDPERLDPALLARCARGRLSLSPLAWDARRARQVADLHLAACSGAGLLDLLPAGMLELLEARLVKEYGQPSPAAWVTLAETVHHWKFDPPPEKPPSGPQELEDHLVNLLYSRHFPLRVDEGRHGAWRGPQFISLPDQVLQLLVVLRRHRGQPVNFDTADLRDVVGSKNNLHSLARRLRSAVEPIDGTPIYVFNDRGEGGYWLENFI